MKKQLQNFAILVLATIFIIAPALMPITSVADVAQAQEKKEKPKKPKSRRSQVLTKTAFNQITAAQEALAAEQHDEALRILKNMISSSRMKPYEKGVAQQTIGFVWVDKDDYTRAAREFERAISMGVLPENVVNDILYNLAQLYLADDKPVKALQYVNRWLKTVAEPSPSAYGLRAQIYLVKEDLKRAERDIDIALAKSKNPKEAWYRIKLSILLQKERYKEALPVLELSVEKFPGKKPFWQQLSAVYYELNMETKAFSAQQSMFAQGMLESSKELERMAQLYLYNDYPFRAARILDKGIKEGKIKTTEKNWERLANAWLHSREWKKSRQPLLNAAKVSDTGKLYVQLGQAYIQDEDWKTAEKYLKAGIEKGKLKKREANSLLILGITQTRLEKYEDAIKTFRKAGDFDDVATDAFRWIRSLERRLAKIAEEKKAKEKAEKKQG